MSLAKSKRQHKSNKNNKTMKRITIIALMLLAAMSLTSCYTNRVNVAGYTSEFGEEKTYDRAKQWYLFEGLIPIGRAHLNTPADGVCQIRSYYSPLDALITVLTGGLVSTRTVKCYYIEPGSDIREIYHPGDKVIVYDKKQKKNVEATIVTILDQDDMKVRMPSGQIKEIEVKKIGGKVGK